LRFVKQCGRHRWGTTVTFLRNIRTRRMGAVAGTRFFSVYSWAACGASLPSSSPSRQAGWGRYSGAACGGSLPSSSPSRRAGWGRFSTNLRPHFPHRSATANSFPKGTTKPCSNSVLPSQHKNDPIPLAALAGMVNQKPAPSAVFAGGIVFFTPRG